MLQFSWRRRERCVFRLPFAASTFGVQLAIVGTLASLATGSVPSEEAQWAPDTFGGWASDRIVVRLPLERARAVRSALSPTGEAAETPVGESPWTLFSTPTRQLLRTGNAGNIRPAIPLGFAFPDLAADHGLDRVFVIDVPAGTDTQAMATALSVHRSDFELAGVDGIGGVAEAIPNDQFFNLQYNMRNAGWNAGWLAGADTKATLAWSLHTGDESVTIAIIDSGVFPHQDFADRLLPGRNVVPGYDPNLTNDVCGEGHGTHVAGIAAAGGNDGEAVAGMNWHARILPVRVLSSCHGFAIDTAAGIVWAADNGADVANLSLQFYRLSTVVEQTLQAAVHYAHDVGVILVAASGNDTAGGLGVVAFPAALENCVAVSGTTAMDRIATRDRDGWTSNWGPQVDVCAPGDEVLSTLRWHRLGTYSGTSMAAPHVAGLIALIRSFTPELDVESTISAVLETADDLGEPGWDSSYGYGRINAYRALNRASGDAYGACCRPARCADTTGMDCPRGQWVPQTPCRVGGHSCRGFNAPSIEHK